MPPFCLLVDAHGRGVSHGRQGLPVKTQDCVFFLVVRERRQQRSRQALLKHTRTHTHMSNIKTIHRVFLSFFLSAKQPQAKRNHNHRPVRPGRKCPTCSWRRGSELHSQRRWCRSPRPQAPASGPTNTSIC